MSFVPRGHPQQVAHVDRRVPRLPGFELPPVTYDVDDRATDPADFAIFDARFRFTIDVAASNHNAKCPRYFTVEDDGLAQTWNGERVWCNPPYSDIRAWVEKAWQEAAHTPAGYSPTGAHLIVMLLPANRTEQGWWQDLTCPVREECLEDALSWETQGQRNGFVGGLSPEERDHEVRYRRYAARRATA